MTMTNKDILATFKKHIDGIEDNCIKNMSKYQIHRFSENIKGINEFIGAAQSISVKITKIKKLAEKIGYIDELLETPSDNLEQLKQNRASHISNIETIMQDSTFIGIQLFDTELSCVINGKEIKLNVKNPMQYMDNSIIEYCQEVQNEISKILSLISNLMASDSNHDIENIHHKDIARGLVTTNK